MARAISQGKEEFQLHISYQDSTTPPMARPFEIHDIRCLYSAALALALGFCWIDFIVCLHGFAHDTFCIQGYLFDHVLLTCLPAGECGRKTGISTTVTSFIPSRYQSLCAGMSDGSLKSLGPCLGQYVICHKGSAELHHCTPNSYVFSTSVGSCVSRLEIRECENALQSDDGRNWVQAPHSASTQEPLPEASGVSSIRNTSSFCLARDDGLYRHPIDCAGVIQCFGKEQYEYESCPRGLVFNELSGGCDYKANVPGCITPLLASSNGSASEESKPDGCLGAPHGDYIVDDTDCSVYYRCVWGKLEKMMCPDGTIFNQLLSVCDYTNEAPKCLSKTSV